MTLCSFVTGRSMVKDRGHTDDCPKMCCCLLSMTVGCLHTSCFTNQAQFTCPHVQCHISDCMMAPQSVCVNTPPGWSLRVALVTLDTVHDGQSSYRLQRYFPWHGTSFPRSTIHVSVARQPSHSSRPLFAQGVAFQSTASVVPRLKTLFRSLQSSATCRSCRRSPVHPSGLL